ncbi:hypothetical protein CMMCAS03_01740 [Clavibacter michiganensis subsp. michiganensis]|nr:hypothetical protein CMMCAS04_03830 [Clavibacter michiganensis subsp. michiganensis]OUD95935.1 hypothetical protein CMMCAS03_01740 [Clavibacter michiganensis subsp. michiganensis]
MGLQVGDAAADGEALEGVDPRRPVPDPAPADDGVLLRETQHRLPDLEPAGEVGGAAEELEHLGRARGDDARADHGGHGDAARQHEAPADADASGDEGEGGDDGGHDERDQDRGAAGEGQGEEGDEDPDPGVAAADRARRVLQREHDEAEQRDHGEQVRVADDALDPAAAEELPAGPGERGGRAGPVVGEERHDRPAHHDGHEQLEGERQPEDDAERASEALHDLGPRQQHDERQRRDGRRQLDEHAERRLRPVLRPRDGEHRDAREREQRDRQHAHAREGARAREQRDARDQHAERDRPEAPPAEAVAPHVTGERGDEDEGREAPEGSAAGGGHAHQGIRPEARVPPLEGSGGAWAPDAGAPCAPAVHQTKAACPVIARPTMSVFISRVPS